VSNVINLLFFVTDGGGEISWSISCQVFHANLMTVVSKGDACWIGGPLMPHYAPSRTRNYQTRSPKLVTRKRSLLPQRQQRRKDFH
jgi:hypothetical protein